MYRRGSLSAAALCVFFLVLITGCGGGFIAPATSAELSSPTTPSPTPIASPTVVTLSPTAATVGSGSTQQFSAAVTGSSDPSAELRRHRRPTVMISPMTATVPSGATQQFSETVTALADQSVTWLVNGVAGGCATTGTISTSGLYTAPTTTSQLSAMVAARSNYDGTMSANAAVTVTAAPVPTVVTISPMTATVASGAAQQFAASVTGPTNQSVTWLVNGTAGGSATTGTISASGLYTAPSTNTQLGVTVAARSSYDGTMSGNATVTVTAAQQPTVVTISPTSATVASAGTQQFSATVTGPTNQSVTWLVNGIAGGSTATGTISSSGLYTAPTTNSQLGVTIAARSNYDGTMSTNAAVTVSAAQQPTVVTISPTSATVASGGTQQFSAMVTGPTNQSVTWRVNGTAGGSATTGTISSSGLYAAPTTNSQLSVTIAARSSYDGTMSSNATVTVSPQTVVTISPTSATIASGATQQFSATVTGPTNQSVTWLVNGTAGGSATTGTISSSGLYTAPTTNSQLSVTVAARSNYDGTMSTNAAVTVSPQTAVTISPTSATVTSGTTQQFSATVTGPTDQSVTWLVNGTPGGGSSTGVISSSGQYSAPTTSSQLSVTVTARSNYDATVSANAAVTVAPQSSAGDLYIATNGSDSNACTATAPCATFNHVDGIVKAGQTVHVMAGTYNLTSSTCISTSTSGSSSSPITWQSDVDGAAKINGNGICNLVWHVTGSYLRIIGFDITGVQNSSSASLLMSEGAGGNVEVAYNTVHDLNASFVAAVDMEPYGNGNYTGAPCSVHDNVFYNIAAGANVQFGDYSMYIACGTNTTVYNNLIYNEGSIGIHCWHAANQVHIYNNTIDHAVIGILVGTGDGGYQTNAYFDVSNNIVTNASAYGIFAEDNSPGLISPTSVFRNNLMYNNAGDWYYDHLGSTTTITSALTVTGTVSGKDPMYVNPASGNYHLSTASPAVGAGTVTSYTPTLDLTGTTRSNPPSIGAYEH